MMSAGTPEATFAALLRHFRLAAGLTQEVLAERAGLSVRGLSDLERGVNRAPRPETLRLLADALGLSPLERAQLEALGLRHGNAPGSRPPAPGAPLRPAGSTGSIAAAAPLVGRDREMGTLETFLAGEGPPVLLLAGPPGIGKSRLLSEARDRAAAAGWRALSGGGRRRGGQEPFAPITAALEQHLAALSPVGLRSALRGCAWLVRLLPELADGPVEPLPAWQVSPEQERRLMFRATASFLSNVAGPAGALLVLDDLQWAGADALDLLAALTQRQAAGLASSLTSPLRVLGAYRDTEVGPHDAFSLLLADLAQAELVTHHTLEPLAAEDAECLLAALLPDEVGPDMRAQRRHLAGRVGGVPFFLISWARQLRDRPPSEGGGAAPPWDVRQGIRQRVAALPEEARAILALAAVAGREAPGALLASAAEQPEGAVPAALEEACRAHLLQEVGGSYRFAHDVVHEVVEAGLSAARRALLHRRLAAALERQEGEPPVEALAYHCLRGGDRGKAAEYLGRAGERAAARHADAAAEGYFAERAALLDGLGQAREASAARERLGAVLTRRSRYTEALAVLDQAAAVYRDARAWKEVARVVARQGALHAELGSCAEGLRLVQPVLARLEPLGPSPELVELYIAVDDLCMHGGEVEPRLVAAERALATARALGGELLLAEACGARGGSLMAVERIGEALGVLEEGLRHLEAAGTPVNLCAIRLLACLAWAQYADGQRQAGRRSMDRALEVAEQHGDPRYVAWILSERGHVRVHTGDWAGAAEDQERGMALQRQIGLSHGSGAAIGNLGMLRLLQGRLAEAACLFEEARAISERSGNALWAWSAECCLAEVARREGRLVEARDRFVALYGRPEAAAGCMWVEAAVGLPRAHLELGEVGAAGAAVDRVAAPAGDADSPTRQVEVLAVRALVATRQGRWAEAARCLEEGFALARSVTYPYGEGRLLHASGLLHAVQGQPAPARAQLEGALAILTRLGARTDMAAVAADLAALAR